MTHDGHLTTLKAPLEQMCSGELKRSKMQYEGVWNLLHTSNICPQISSVKSHLSLTSDREISFADFNVVYTLYVLLFHFFKTEGFCEVNLQCFEEINDGPEINEENNENNLVFCIDPRRALQSNQYQDLFLLNPSHRNKIRLFSIYPNTTQCRILTH